MRSFIGWIGGKSHLKNQIISLIPSGCNRYIEVCGGAGWVLFGKDKIKGQIEVFNDIDGDLINLYKQIKTTVQHFKKKLTGYNLVSCFRNIAMRLSNKLNLRTYRGRQGIFT